MTSATLLYYKSDRNPFVRKKRLKNKLQVHADAGFY